MQLIHLQKIARNFDKLVEIVNKDAKFISQTSEVVLSELSDEVKFFLVEAPYVDKDYRSIFYSDFSKRHKLFERDVIRVHLYSNNINDDDYSDGYLGFLTLRNTPGYHFGRSYINPKAISGVEGFIMLSEFESNILDQTQKIKAFPWMQQDINISRCAHVAAWCIMRYFGQRKKPYADLTIGEMAHVVRSETRKVPSSGLTMHQIVQLLNELGFSMEQFKRKIPKLVCENDTRDGPAQGSTESTKVDSNMFDIIIHLYLESGIPVLCGLSKKLHAITAIGHGKIKDADEYIQENEISTPRVIDSLQLCSNWICIDDNHAPYRKIHKKPCLENGTYSFEDIDLIAVPLHDKMYLTPKDVLSLVAKLCEEKSDVLKTKILIRRVFLTSSNKLKKSSLHIEDLRYKKYVKHLTLPKFVWVVEYSTPENFKNGLVDYRIVVDSTATAYDNDAIIYFQSEWMVENPSTERKFPIEKHISQQITGNLEHV